MDAPRHAIIQKYSPPEKKGNICWHMASMMVGVGASTVQERKKKILRTQWRTNVPLKPVCVCGFVFFFYFILVLIAVSPLFLPKPIIIVSLRKGKRRLI